MGPIRLGFGNVVAAGCVLRKDVLADGGMLSNKPHTEATVGFSPRSYPRLSRIVENNFVYLANLAALEQWYIHVRQSFFQEQEFGELIYRGVLKKLAMAVEERFKRIEDMAGKLAVPGDGGAVAGGDEPARRALRANATRLRELFMNDSAARQAGREQRDLFLAGLQKSRKKNAAYIDTIQGLPADVSSSGTRWLEQIVGSVTNLLASLVPVDKRGK